MAFHARMPRDLAFSDQHLPDGTAIIGSVDSLDSAAEPAAKPFALAAAGGEGAAPSWLSASSLTHHGSVLHLQSHSDSSPSPGAAVGQWFPRLPVLRRDAGDDEDPAADDPAAEEGSGGGEAGEGTWRSARYKAEIMAHPLYEQLLSAHVACLRIATPVDQLPRIDEQLAQTHHVVAKYSALGAQMLSDDKELDQFMTQYVLLLRSFKEQLQQHVRVHAMEAVMACWELEQSLQSLTGISPGEGTGATMSDDDEEQDDSEANMFDGSLDGSDSMGFGPLVPTESERTLMERVRQELKHELKQGYKEKIVDIREEILRKRRAGKLPGDTTSTLKAWWQSHSKWPYPTVSSYRSLEKYWNLDWNMDRVGGRQGKAGARNRIAIKTDKQLVHQPKEKKLAQQSYFIKFIKEQEKKVKRSNFDSKLLGLSTMKTRLVFQSPMERCRTTRLRIKIFYLSHTAVS